MLLIFIVALELTRLTVPVVRKLIRGERRWLLWGQVNDADAADTGDDLFCCAHSAEGRKTAHEQHVVVQLYREWLACVPLRHVAACMLSSIALIYFALYFTGIFNDLAGFIDTVRSDYADFDPTSPMPENPSALVIWGLCLVGKKGLGDSVMGQLFGTVHDICTYAPWGFFVVALVCLAFIGHSFVAIHKHHTALVQRYSGHASVDSGDLKAQLELAATPQLRSFGFFHATEYLLSHLLVHLAVASVTAILVVIVGTAIVTYAGGIPGLTILAGVASRGAIMSGLKSSWPRLLALLLLLGTRVGVDVMAVVEPVRAMVSRVLIYLCMDDGPIVLAPRVFLNVDALGSATLGCALGLVDGFTRIIIAMVWGLLRCAMLHEPVVPMAAAGFDRPFQAYGGMMRSAHVAQLQRAAGGFGFGGTVITESKWGSLPAEDAPPVPDGSGALRSGQRAHKSVRVEESYTYADAYLHAASTVED